MPPCIPRRLFGAVTCPKCARSTYTLARDLSSKRSSKHRRASPSVSLIAALRAAGLDRSLPSFFQGKTDHSYSNPRLHDPQSHANTVYHRPLSSSGLQSAVATLIQRKFIPDLRASIEPRATVAELEHELTTLQLTTLRARNYNVVDAYTWASIISQPDLTKAAALLQQCSLSPSNNKPVPLFVLLFLLRRPLPYVTAEVLRSLIIVSWHELHRYTTSLSSQSTPADGPQRTTTYPEQYPVATTDSIFLIVIRLIRFARHVWPAALFTIASMFTEAFDINTPANPKRQSMNSQKLHEIHLADISQKCNKMLELLSLPSTKNSFLNVPYCQSAQFHVLGFMAKHQPPLTISREGYRAVVSLHLASKKGPREREWHQLKSRSWPPWKEDRTGLDADKDFEYGLSNASKALRQLAQGGYPLRVWERVAQIFAGWDLDRSPTIQTRTFLLDRTLRSYARPGSSAANEAQVDSDNSINVDENDPYIWAARITATRTAQEAWAAFLSWKDCSLPPSQVVYRAMLEKLAARVESASVSIDEKSNSFMRSLDAGDAREPVPTPTSPREITYTRLPVPTLDQLANEMFENKIDPSLRTLLVLLSGTDNLSHAVRYLRHGARVMQSISSLLSKRPEQDPRLSQVPKPVFSAFIRLLCVVSLVTRRHKESSSSGAAWWERRPLQLAQRLVEAYSARDLALYNNALESMAETSERQVAVSPSTDSTQVASEFRLVTAAAMIKKHEELLKISDQMTVDGVSVDAHTFSIHCSSLSSLILATNELSNNRLSINYLRHSKENLMSRIENEYVPNIRLMFTQIFHGSSQMTQPDMTEEDPKISESSASASTLPDLLDTPSPYVLHGYIRVLGLRHEHWSLIELARWMRSYRDDINSASEEPRSGKRMLRRCHIAMRVYTEHNWECGGTESPKPELGNVNLVRKVGDGFFDPSRPTFERHKASPNSVMMPRKMQKRLRSLVESAGWEWPDDEEVQAYIARAHPFEGYRDA